MPAWGTSPVRPPPRRVSTGASPALPTAVRAALQRHLGDDGVRPATQVQDWTGRWSAPAAAVLRPADHAAVVAAVSVCAHAGLPLTVRGGNTGLVGGAVPPPGGVVLDVSRLTGVALQPADPRPSALAGAGTPLVALQAAARSAGLRYGVDLAARDSATLGGTVATNAGGLAVVRYGATGQQVLGVRAVLADGGVVDETGPAAAQTSLGPRLSSLLVGSEGTLAVLTAVRVGLHPAPPPLVDAVVPTPDLASALALLPQLRPVAWAVEWLEDPPRLLVRVSDPAVLPADSRGADRRDWAAREALSAAANAGRWPAHKLDVGLPLDGLAAFRAELDAVVGGAVDGPVRLLVWGHLAVGTLHVNVGGPAPDDERVDDAVLTLAARHGGAVASEHGVGRAKVRWLGLSRTAPELAALRRVKQALDPAGLLNPGVLLPG